MFLLFDLIFLIYAVIYLPYLVITRRWYPGYSMRFGIFSSALKAKLSAKPNIWLHAVSVGEVAIIDAFASHLKQGYTQHQIIVTVTTKTGYALARKRLANKAIVIPSPLDFSFIAARFVHLIKPRIYIVAETEIWPNLFVRLSKVHVPIVIVNGRISDVSWGRYQLIRGLLKKTLASVSLWCMQSETDAQRIIALGAGPSRVLVTGNVKFDDVLGEAHNSTDRLKASPLDRLWVAGSTHPGEESVVLDVYVKVIKKYPSWRLLIAPRHVERTGNIMALIESRGLTPILFSERKGRPLDNNAVILVDTIGHLRALYVQADLVFVGKSLCARGGQNIIEPAFNGKAIVVGPNVDNFRDIVACFLMQGGLVQVGDAQQFEEVIVDLAGDDAKRERMGQRALEVVQSNRGAIERSLEHIKGWLS